MVKQMNGWIISFLSDSAQNTMPDPVHKDEYCSLSWSPYDRICIEEAESFKELCTASSVTKPDSRWPGSERTMHIIYDADNFEKETWKLSNLKQKIIDNDYYYYCIVTLRYSKELSLMKNNPDFIKTSENIRRKMYLALEKFINDKNLQCDYRGFLPLSIEDAVVIFCANDLATINNCIKFLKTLRMNGDPLFYSLSNFSGLNNIDKHENPKMDALVKLNLYPYDKEEDVIHDLTKCGIKKENIMVRSSCLFVNLDHKNYDIVGFYRQKDGIFNGESTFYRNHFKSSRTFWTENSSYEFDYVFGNIDVKIKSIGDDIDKDKNKGNPRGMIAAFITSEFNRVIDTPRFESWKPILINQREIFKRIASHYEQNEQNQDLCELINFTQNSLSIINQACSPAYEIPYHNSFYSSSHNDLLKMYYGIISAIFKIGFAMPHKTDNVQHPIYFAINFESSISIHSRMFTVNGSRDRFVVFFLPSDNLYNYPEMIPCLIHEVFHYIAPYDRETRADNILTAIIIKILFRSVLRSFENFESFKPEEQSLLYQFYLSKNNIQSILYKTKKKIQNIEPNFFTETSSFINNKYFQTFDDFRNIYVYIYSGAKALIQKEFNNKALLKFKGYKSESYKDLTISEIFSGAPLKLTHSIDKVENKSDTDEFFSIDFVSELEDFVKDMTLNSKEVFCDICISNILEMSFEEYILFYYNNLEKKSNKDNLIKIFKYGLGRINKMNITSTDIRLLMMILFFIEKETKVIKSSKLSSWLNRKVKNMSSRFSEGEDNEAFSWFTKVLRNILFEEHETYNTYIDSLKEMTGFNTVRDSFDSDEIKNLMEKLRSAYRDDVKNSINIDNINYFTYLYYDTSKSPHSSIRVCTRYSGSPATFNQFYNAISSVSEYVNLVLDLMKHKNFDFFKPWFRGMCNNEFPITPSLFRVADPKLSLYANQANIVKYAYEKTLFFDNLWKAPIRDQMCFLQHYGMSTNLLDFSMDMLVALHFALNPDVQSDRESIDSGDFEPVVYMFDSIEYSSAIIALNKGHVDDENIFFSNASNISPIVHTLGKTELDKYFVTDMSIEKMTEHTRKYNETYTPDKRQDEYPVPIIVPQSNDRIHIQNGTFLAYSLDSKPAGTGRERYNYLSLQSIQKQYSDLLVEAGIEERRFLYPIFINPNSVNQLRDELKRMSITEGKLYPEFSTIFREGMAEYKSKLNLKK